MQKELIGVFYLTFFELISTIRFREDSKIITEADDTLNLQLIPESPLDGTKVSYTLHTLNGREFQLGESKELNKAFEFHVPEELAGTGMAQIIAKSETGAHCSTIIFIK